MIVEIAMIGTIFMSVFGAWRHYRRGHGISIIIPFRSPEHKNRRNENFDWLVSYWRCQLPGAQIVIGEDPCHHLTFSKSAAVNAAASKATGDIFAIIDADGYVPVESVVKCAEEIRKARRHGHKLWFVPYRHFYRLTDRASRKVIESSPCDPYQFPSPPDPGDIQNQSGSGHGHWFGALAQIVPREAFEAVGGWDCRFRGWGGEDHSAMRATDTLFWRHKTLPGQVLHLWHPMLGKDGSDNFVEWKERIWENQSEANTNGNLAARYSRANGDRERMRALVDEQFDGV
jgi:glycosyltransferase involved in cell wall biosynthesis